MFMTSLTRTLAALALLQLDAASLNAQTANLVKPPVTAIESLPRRLSGLTGDSVRARAGKRNAVPSVTSLDSSFTSPNAYVTPVRPERVTLFFRGDQLVKMGLRSAADALPLLRPEWFIQEGGGRVRVRRKALPILIDGAPGTFDQLKGVAPKDLSAMRSIPPSTALALHLGPFPEGVIEVVTHRRR
jgi:hypothetical protein